MEWSELNGMKRMRYSRNWSVFYSAGKWNQKRPGLLSFNRPNARHVRADRAGSGHAVTWTTWQPVTATRSRPCRHAVRETSKKRRYSSQPLPKTPKPAQKPLVGTV